MADLTVLQDRKLIRSTYASSRFLRVEIAAPPSRAETRRPAGQPGLRHRPLGIDGRREDRARQGGGAGRHRSPRIRRPLRGRRVRRSDRRPHPQHRGHPRLACGGPGHGHAPRRAWQHEPRRGLAPRVPAGRGQPHRGRREPRAPPHRRSRQPGSSPRTSSPATPPSCAGGASPPPPSASARTSTMACSAPWRTPGAATSVSSRTPEQILDHIAGEVGELLEVTARDVVLGDHRVRPDLGRAALAVPGGGSRGASSHPVGDLVADQVVEVL